MTDFSMANMVCCHLRIERSFADLITGLRPREIHDQVLRGQLPRKPGHCARAQITLDISQ